MDSEYGFDISADGRFFAFSSNINGGWEIFEFDTVTKSSPAQLTTGAGGKFAPRYSPAGDKLVFACDLDGSENFQFQVLERSSGKTRKMEVPESLSLQPSCGWSPDGSQIAVLAIGEDGNEIGLLDVNVGSYTTFFILDEPPVELDWSPDGRLLAVQVEVEGSNHALGLLSKPGLEIKWVMKGDTRLNAIHPSISPDGKHLAFSNDDQGFYDICSLDLASGELRWRTRGVGEKTRPCWSPDGQTLAFLHTEGATTSLVTLDLKTTQLKVVGLASGVYARPKFAPSGDKLIALFEDPSHPPFVQEIPLSITDKSKSPVNLSQSSSFKNIVSPQEISYPSPDGVAIPALLYEPVEVDGQALHPAVIVIHGGPDWHFQAGWNPLMAYLAGLGWLVLAPNYRGSTGYGKGWLNASRYQMGKLDSGDVNAGADHLVNKYHADPKSLAVIGRSHGGYLVMCCLTQRPELWCAGSAMVPVMNLFTSHERSRQDLQHWNIQNYGDPLENKALWIERSPYFFLEKVQSPVQIISGGRDVRCPPEDAQQAHLKLLELGKSSEFLLYQDEGHVFMKQENILDADRRIVEFLQSVFQGKDLV